MRIARTVLFLFLLFMVFPVQMGGVLLYKPLGAVLVFATLLTLGYGGGSGDALTLSLLNSSFVASLIIIGAGIAGSLHFGVVEFNSLWKMAQNVILLIAVIHVVKRPSDLKLAVAGIGTGGVLSAMSGVIDLVTFRPYRLEGILGNANGYGQVCAMASVCLTGLMIISRRRFVKACLLALDALCLVGLFYSGSRGAVLALIGGALGFLMLKSTRRTGIAFLTLGILLAAFISEGTLFQRWSTAFRVEKVGRVSSVEMRTDLAARGLRVYKDSPIVGVGFGNIRKGMALVGVDDLMVSHNAVIQAMAETGTIGAAAFLFLAFTAGAVFYRRARLGQARPAERAIAATLFVLLLQVFIAQLFSGNYIHPIWYVLFALSQGYRRMGLGREGKPLLTRNLPNLRSQRMRHVV